MSVLIHDPEFDTKVKTLENSIKSINDYPKPGILFRDISSLCDSKDAFPLAIKMLADIFKDQGIDKVVSAEARGFVFGAPLAAMIGAGFVMVRKPGKLPRNTIEESYELEYGSNKLQIHADSINKGDKVLICDDLLATGGTVDAMIKLVKRLGGDIKCAAFAIELFDLGGKELIEKNWGVECFSLVKFPGH